MSSFKTDESFLEKISIGAIGTQKVFENLKFQNHNPIELERGSMSYKIWKKIKIKRIRVPDILCVKCGTRIESRAKTNLEISMSHSLSDPERGWDFGMKDIDFVAIIACEKSGERPIDWKADNFVQYILVRDLREAEKQNQVILVKPKGAGEGFESRINWIAAISSANGIIKSITDNSIQFSRESDKRTITLHINKKGINLKPLVRVQDKIFKNQIIASVVPVYQSFTCQSVPENVFLKILSSSALSERYTAAKALAFFNNNTSCEALSRKLKDDNEHIYVKLECASSLAKFDIQEGYDFIKKCLKDNYLQNVLESVVVLAEIKTPKSCQMLCEILQDNQQDSEIRAGAAWGLGEINNKIALETLTESFEAVDENIKIEAARALAKLTQNFTGEILKKFNNSNSVQKSGIAWALSKSVTLTLDDLLVSLKDIDSRQWISYIIGVQGEERYISEIERLKKTDMEMYFAVTLLWKIMNSWVFRLNEY